MQGRPGIKRSRKRQLLHTFRVNRNLQDSSPVYVASGMYETQHLNNDSLWYRLQFVVLELYVTMFTKYHMGMVWGIATGPAGFSHFFLKNQAKRRKSGLLFPLKMVPTLFKMGCYHYTPMSSYFNLGVTETL